MGDPSSPREALALLGEVYRNERTGVLSLQAGELYLRVAVEKGQIVGICPPSPGAPVPPPEALPDPDDSTKLKLDRVLTEIGLRSASESSTRPEPPGGPSAGELREQLLSLLADGGETVRFEETGDLPEDTVPAAGATEPIILEAVRRVGDAEAVRGLLGDTDRRLAATTALAEERTLTLTEGYLLSRMDGISTARQILQIVPLESDETERSLAGLLLTGRVMYQLTPVPERPGPRPADPPVATPPPTPPPTPPLPAEERPAPSPSVPAVPPAGPRPEAEADPEALARRRELIELFQSLPRLNHFEVLGVEPGCDDASVKRAHVALVKRYHPDTQRDAALADLDDVLEAIFIRIGEAWEVLGSSRSRSAYEARLRVTARTGPPVEEDAGPRSGEDAGSSAPEDTLREAQQLLGESRYWDAIQMLEAAVPRLQPQSHQHRGRILLARAYSRNPKWIRKAEETLQRIVHEDPANAEAHYELGVLYKARGLTARAQAMFRKAVDLRPDYRRAAAEIGPGEGPPAEGFLRRLFKGGGSKGA